MKRAMVMVFAALMVLSKLGDAGPALALGDTTQVLSGGNFGISTSNGANLWTAPGSGTVVPDISGGEPKAQMPFPAGTLSNLKFRLTTLSLATGTVIARIRVNGAPTNISCPITLSAQSVGSCTSNVAQAINEDDLVSVKINQVLTGTPSIGFSYTLQFD